MQATMRKGLWLATTSGSCTAGRPPTSAQHLPPAAQTCLAGLFTATTAWTTSGAPVPAASATSWPTPPTRWPARWSRTATSARQPPLSPPPRRLPRVGSTGHEWATTPGAATATAASMSWRRRRWPATPIPDASGCMGTTARASSGACALATLRRRRTRARTRAPAPGCRRAWSSQR